MSKEANAQKVAEQQKPVKGQSADVPVLVRVTLADRLRIAALLSR